MRLTRSQLILVVSVGVLALLFVGLLTGIIPGARRTNQTLPEVKLTVWGTLDPYEAFTENFNSYSTLNPNVQVEYTQIDPEKYESTLINALAAGRGPDIFMFHNSWLPKHSDKITPMPDTQMGIADLRQLFPSVVEQDFAPDGKIFALPLYIDTLSLLYNADIFDSAAIAVPPADWLEFQNLVPRVRISSADGHITRAAAAIGGSDTNIPHAADLVSLLMLQAGTTMTDQEFSRASFADPISGFYPGVDAVSFYTKFSTPTNLYYTWNEALPNALDSFSNGTVAMMFGYSTDIAKIKNKNPLLRFNVIPMPQPNKAKTLVNFADYWGLAVSNKSQAPDWAWSLIQYLTTTETLTDTFLAGTGLPPALRATIKKHTNDPELGVFARQALTARSWPRIDNEKIAVIFSDMIRAINNDQLDIRSALNQAQEAVSTIMASAR